MKPLTALLTIIIATALFPACEKQDYKETKMFHDVPKRVGDKPAETPKTEEAKPAPAPAPTPAPDPDPAPAPAPAEGAKPE